MIRNISYVIAAVMALMTFQAPAHAAGDIMMPFVRATDGSGSVAATSADVSAKLTAAGSDKGTIRLST